MKIDNMIVRLREMTQTQLNGCILRTEKGLPLYTPDGAGHYPALWTRDFAYMLEYAGELIPLQDAVAGVEYLLAGARPDGWIPDRVDTQGNAAYTAGDGSFGRPNLDNGAFLILAADCVLNRLPVEAGAALFQRWAKGLEAGLAVLPLNKDGLIENDPANPHSPYGFTDCIGKTGTLLMESLLLWRALKVFAARKRAYGLSAGDLEARAQAIEKQVECVFVQPGSPMLLAATVDCRQIDVWGSCYAISIGFPLSAARREGIARWLLENAEGVVEAGQIRHTAPGETWQRLLTYIEPGKYQNGAYWATASGWYMDAVRNISPTAAQQVLKDVLAYFERYGIYECVNGEYRNLLGYVVSAANVYGAAKALRDQ